jgi:hypothetical protein
MDPAYQQMMMYQGMGGFSGQGNMGGMPVPGNPNMGRPM